MVAKLFSMLSLDLFNLNGNGKYELAKNKARLKNICEIEF